MLSDEDIATIQDMIRREVRRAFRGQTVPPGELKAPPLPKKHKGGKSQTAVMKGERVRMSFTADREIFLAFERWCESRGMTHSRAFDTMVWNVLGKPRLSFQEPEGDDEL